MRTETEVTAVQDLISSGLNDCEIARRTGIPRTTVRDWRRGQPPAHRARDCSNAHPLEALPEEQYAYLLGAYLGDGCISPTKRDGVFKLRIVLDKKYPEIIDAVGLAMRSLVPANRVGHTQRVGCVEVSMYWRHWPCLFPQHGPGRKHLRKIALADWQKEIVEREPEAFLCGLIDSDGCRIVARYKENGNVRIRPRYVFSNISEDILGLFCQTCDALGADWTRANFKDVAVARRRSVDLLDEFIGPKG